MQSAGLDTVHQCALHSSLETYLLYTNAWGEQGQLPRLLSWG